MRGFGAAEAFLFWGVLEIPGVRTWLTHARMCGRDVPPFGGARGKQAAETVALRFGDPALWEYD
jgi:hypothetical protein